MRAIREKYACKLSMSVVLASSLIGLTAAPSAQSAHGDAIPGEYIVVLKDYPQNQVDSVADQALADAGVPHHQIKRRMNGVIKGFHGKFSAKQLEKLERDPRVQQIEQDREIKAPPVDKLKPFGVNDPIPAQPAQVVGWGAARVGYGDGTGRTVWVVDSGIRPDHPDLTVDMARSRSFVYGTSSVLDGYGHGTAVSGIIAARNNDIGIVGVAAGATIIALRVFDDSGSGSLSNAYSAVNHVSAYGTPGDVVNLSLGGGISSVLDNAIVAAAAKGFYFSIAAGNSATDCSNNSPARANGPNIYTVSSMNQAGALSGFSSYGPPVDFAAPGEGIYTTNHSGGYGSCTGTSCAAPHVAGILALRGSVGMDGYITGDKDGSPDPIASLSGYSDPILTPSPSPAPSPSPTATAKPVQGKKNGKTQNYIK